MALFRWAFTPSNHSLSPNNTQVVSLDTTMYCTQCLSHTRCLTINSQTLKKQPKDYIQSKYNSRTYKKEKSRPRPLCSLSLRTIYKTEVVIYKCNLTTIHGRTTTRTQSIPANSNHCKTRITFKPLFKRKETYLIHSKILRDKTNIQGITHRHKTEK